MSGDLLSHVTTTQPKRQNRAVPTETGRAALGKTLGFMQSLWSLSHALQARSKRMDHELGITGPQRLAVRIIGRIPGISPRELAVTMRVHPSTLTGIMKRLEEREFVSRVGDDRDGRSVHLQLTARGRAADHERSNTVEAAVRRALAQLDPEEVRATERVLSCLVEELDRESR